MILKHVILLGLLIAANAQAITIYRYEIANHSDGELREQGTPNSGYIEFQSPSGTGGLDFLYDLALTSYPSPTIDYQGNPVPLIPSRTYTLLDEYQSDSRTTFAWDESRISGDWGLSFYTRDVNGQAITSTNINSATIENFWPMEYYYNESSMSIDWKFTGTRNVPENSGLLLGVMGLGIVLLYSSRAKA
jgi:hypothetical protein